MIRACVLSAGLAAAAVDKAPGPDVTDLARGIRQVEDGDFETALLSLDSAARALSLQPKPPRELATAYLYLGLAYVGLKQESLARTRFQQALARDPTLHLDPDEFPPAALRVFEAAGVAHREAQALEKKARTKRAKGGTILLGVGGAVAAGIGVAAATATDSPDLTPPTVAVTVSPEGQAITGVTVMGFVAYAQDPKGRNLIYEWRFGDDASTSSGPTAQHVFRSDGTFQVQLTVDSGFASTTTSTNVTARSLSGVWHSTPGPYRETVFQLEQAARSMSGQVFFESFSAGVTCQLQDPRQVQCFYQYRFFCNIVFTGDVDATLRSIEGSTSVACGGDPRYYLPIPPDRPVTLTRP